MNTPTTQEIKKARAEAGLTQSEAAKLIYKKSYRIWQDWERGTTAMNPAYWELFLIKIGKDKV